jgi:signal transduction histidine kinase
MNRRPGATRKWSIQRKLPLLMSGIFVVVFIVTLGATYIVLRRAAEDSARNTLRRATQELAASASTSVAASQSRYRSAAHDETVHDALARARATAAVADSDQIAATARVLSRLQTPADTGLVVELWSADGHLVASTGADSAARLPVSGEMGARATGFPLAGLTRVLPTDSAQLGQLFEKDGGTHFWVAIPVRENSRVVGYIAKESRIAATPQTQRSLRALAGEDVSIYYRNVDGTVWTSLSGKRAEPPTPIARESGAGRRPEIGRVLFDEQQIAGTPLVIAMEVPAAEVLAGPRKLVQSLALLALLLLVGGTAAAWFIARQIVMPLRGLTQAAESIAGGHYDARVPTHGDDEVARLAESFNHMAVEISQSHDELERQTAAAQAANRAKSDFLATMSHELRTPLNAIGGYTELLQLELRGPISEAQRRDLTRIRAAQAHLLGLINAMLDLTRIESGRIQYDFRPVPVAAFLASIEELVAPQAAAKSLSLDLDPVDPALGMLADREKARQILINLLSNAIRFTPEHGRICVSARGLDDASTEIRVRDTGPGIPVKKQQEIFEPFVQLDRSLNQPQEGVGLGLAISRDLARGMHGDLRVQSAGDGGAEFILTLPRTAVDSQEFQTGEMPANIRPAAAS